MIRLKTYSRSEWSSIVTEHSGKSPRYSYSDIKEDPAYQSKHVIRGWYTPKGGGADELATTGFLENESGQVIAGVNAISKDDADYPPE